LARSSGLLRFVAFILILVLKLFTPQVTAGTADNRLLGRTGVRFSRRRVSRELMLLFVLKGRQLRDKFTFGGAGGWRRNTV
jgi:hypothetical protein